MSEGGDFHLASGGVPRFGKPDFHVPRAGITTPDRTGHHRRRGLAGLVVTPKLKTAASWPANEPKDWPGEREADGKNKPRIAYADGGDIRACIQLRRIVTARNITPARTLL